MVENSYWFKRDEFQSRLHRVQRALAEQRQDALLAFLPETVTWITGFFTRGYCSFQFAIIPASGDPIVICRDVEEYYLDSTCVYSERVLWNDSDDKNRIAIEAISEHIGANTAIAVELNA